MWHGGVAELQAHVDRGLSRRAIADIYGVTRNAVVGACYRLGIVGPEQAKKVVAMIVNERKKRARALRSPNPPPKKTTRDRWVRKSKMKYEPFLFPAMADEPEPLRISLLNLTEAQCHWVCEGTDDNCLPTYCGHQCVAGSSWCGHHYRRVYGVRR